MTESVHGERIVTVYTWDSGSDAGHSGVSISDGDYMTLRARRGAGLFNTLFGWPSTGCSLALVEQDIRCEGRVPDRIQRLSVTTAQHQKMERKAKLLRKKIEKNQIMYHLLPGWALLFHLAKALSGKRPFREYSTCPFSGTPIPDQRHRNWKELQNVQLSHCALTVKAVLEAGDIHLDSHKTLPWKLAPIELADQLDREHRCV